LPQSYLKWVAVTPATDQGEQAVYVRIGEKIKKAREEQRLSQADLGSMLGVTATAINYYEKGKRKINIDDLFKLARATGKPLEYFLEDGAGRSAEQAVRHRAEKLEAVFDLVEVPVIGDVRAGKPVMEEQNITGTVLFPRKMARSATFALWVRGESMTGAGIEEGDLVFIRRQSIVDYEGQIVCADTGNGESTLKTFTRDPDGKVRLKAANPAFPDIVLEGVDELKVLGVYAGVYKPPRIPSS
jgi:repressor LexA